MQDNSWLNLVPFLMTNSSGNAKIRWTRILEAIIIAIIAGGLSGYISVSKMEVKIEYLEKAICKIEQRLDKFQSNYWERDEDVCGKVSGKRNGD